MGKYFPPSLQSRGSSIKGGYSGNYNTSDYTEIFFNMPAQNDVDSLFGIDGSNGGHVQFTLKTKSNNTTALNVAYTPDYVTIYFNAKANYSPNGTIDTTKLTQIVYYGSDLYSLAFSNILYQNPHDTTEVGPIVDTQYTIQIRFGDKDLSAANYWVPYPSEINGLQFNFTGFANWRANAVALSEMGEWSNTQTYYAYGPYSATLTGHSNKWLPTFTFEYTTPYSDNIVNIEIRCQYILPSGEVSTESENFSGDLGTPGHFKITRSVNIAPTDTLYIQVVPITENGTIINDPAYITYFPANPANNGIVFGPYSSTIYPGGKIDDGDPTLPDGDLGKSPLLVTEEQKDGVIAKRILSPVISGANAPYSLNVYRFDYFTREAVLIASDIDLSAGAAPYILKDYCVEMGTRYQYAGVVQDSLGNEGLMLWEMFSPFDSGSNPFGELDKLEFSVLTTKNCQLRFQGDPTVTNFKREVQESFQPTIGSEYPHYSRLGKSNYRTLQFNGLVTINFDFTSLFLELDSTNDSYEKRGLLWEKNLIVPIEKVYEQQQISLNRRRFSINSPYIASSGDGDIFSGPATVYDERLLASRKKKYNTQQTSDMIYLERRFREKAMNWLSDGKPKLYRSETEGNMIVITSAATFTPLKGSQRMVYTVQFTMTEIAEYNLTNLLKYNLLPCEIVADVESRQTEFLGDYDPNYSDGILRFPDSDSYDIAAVQNGQPIAPILIAYEQGLRVTGGVPPYTFNVLELPNAALNLHWEQMNRNGIECLRIYGFPESNLSPSILTARVTDSTGTYEEIKLQFGGTSSTGSTFSIDNINSVTYNGLAQEPAVVVRENGVIITPASVSYSNNTNAGIATVTVTLLTGGTLIKSFNILPRTITVTKGNLNVNKVYDGTVSSTGATVTGSVSTSETITASVNVTLGQFTTKAVGANKTVTVGLSLQGIGASNYTLNPSSAVWDIGTITPQTITVTPSPNQSKIYNVADPILTYSVTPALFSGDNMSGLLTRAAGTTVGTYVINQGTLSAGSNYNINFTTGVLFTIVQAPAPTLTWPQASPIIYGQPLSAAMSAATNAYGTFNWTVPTTIPTVINNGYGVTFTPLDTVNYDWSSTALVRVTSVTVSPRQLVLTGVSATDRVYNATTNVTLTGGTLSGVVSGDDVSPVIGAATMSNKNVGVNKIVNFTVTLTGADAQNYTVVLNTAVTVNITARPVTIVSVECEDRAYNGFNTVDVEIVIGGILSGDNIQLNYLTNGEIASPMPGTNIPVITSIVLIGTDRNNYSVPTINATVNITKASQVAPVTPPLDSVTTTTILMTASSGQEFSIDGGTTWQTSNLFTGLTPLTTYQVVSRYAETAIFFPSPASVPRNVTTLSLNIDYTVTGFAGDYDGMAHSVTVTIESGATIMYSTDAGLTYTSSTPPTYTNVGTYTTYFRVTKSGANPETGTRQIIIYTKRVTVTADNKTKALGDPDPLFTYTVNPAIAPSDSFTGILTRSPGETAGNYAILIGTLELSSNYLIDFIPGILNIGGVEITITPDSGQSKIFQDVEPTLTYTFSPSLQPGDSFTGQLSRTAGENVGTYNINIGSLDLPSSYGIVLDPEIFTITPRPVTVTAEAKVKDYGEVDPIFTYTASPALVNQTLTGNLSRASGEDAGTYPITRGSLNNNNYTITYSGAILTINRADISRSYQTYIDSHEYTGSDIEPVVEIIDNLTNTLLIEDTDYTVDYLNNVNVGTGTIVITGINNYQSSMNLNFVITPVVTTLTVEPIGDIEFTGSLIEPLPVVKDGATILEKDTDYTVDYANNLEVGSASVIVTGINSYLGNSVTEHFNIITATYTTAITNIADFNRNYSPIAAPPTPAISNNPESGIERAYYATSLSGPYTTAIPLDAGSYYVKVIVDATENYDSAETAPLSFTIAPLATTFANFSTPSGLSIVYDGNSHMAGIPSVLGATLSKDIDYTLSPDSEAINAGAHTWIYNGIGNYAGSTGTFILTITPYPVTVQLLGATAKFYGDSDPVFGYNSSALIGSDTLSGLAGRDPGENAGNYSLTLGTLTGGINYQLSIAASSATTFTINPRSLSTYTVDWTAGDIDATTFSYTGSPITPIVENWNSTIEPVVGIDVDYSYTTNTDVGSAQATISSISGNFTGSLTFNFEIQ